jgi:hypothetical protein
MSKNRLTRSVGSSITSHYSQQRPQADGIKATYTDIATEGIRAENAKRELNKQFSNDLLSDKGLQERAGWGMFIDIPALEYSNIHAVKQAIRAIAIAGKGLNIYNKDVFNQNYEREFTKSLDKVTPLFDILRDARNGIAFEGDLIAMLAKDMDKIKTLVETLKDKSIGMQDKPLRYIHGGYEKFDMFDTYQTTLSIFLNKHFS